MITKELNKVIDFIDYLSGLENDFRNQKELINEYVSVKNDLQKQKGKGIKAQLQKKELIKEELDIRKKLFPILIEPIDKKMIEDEIYNSKEILQLNNIKDEVFRKSFENLDSNDLQVIQTKFDEYIDFKIQNIDFFNAVDPYFLDFHSLDKYVYEMLFSGEVNDRLINAFPSIQKLSKQSEQPHQIGGDNTKETPPPTKLSDIITHEKSVQIVEKIKVQYKNIKGKRLKLLLIALQDLELIPKERIASMFYRFCKEEFSWDIASYTAMNDYVFNEEIDLEEVESMKGNLKSIINDK